jgi:PilZ domain
MMNLFDREKALIQKLIAPLGIGKDRRTDPRYRASARARLVWRDGRRDREVSVRLIDISRGGASLRAEDAPPTSTVVRVRVEGTREWVEAEVLGVALGPDGERRVRLKFRERCSNGLLEGAVLGRRSRAQHRHNPLVGVESLEGRQLMAMGPFSPALVLVAMVAPIDSSQADPGSADQVIPSATAPADTADSAITASDDGADPGSADQTVATVTAPAVGAVLGSTAQTVPAATAPVAPTLQDIANDPFLATVLYSTPNRMASQIAPDGSVGCNTTWENGQSTTWYIEQQRYGADFVQAGLETQNSALVQQGWKILDWGFNKEAADGSFPGTSDAFHSTSMFVEAAARSLLLEVQSGAPDSAALLAKYLPKVNASAQWLMNPSVAAKGNLNDAPYTHRCWLLAAALGETAALTQDPTMTAAAAVYAQRGLSLQTADGMNPEKGGGDVSYQAYGVLLAERYLATCPDATMRASVQGMIVKALSWEETFIDSNGVITLDGSTRTGQELSRDGITKTIDYKTIVQAFSVVTSITGDPSYQSVARSVAVGRGWIAK